MLSDHSPTTLPQLKAINSQLIHVKYVSHFRYKSNISLSPERQHPLVLPGFAQTPVIPAVVPSIPW